MVVEDLFVNCCAVFGESSSDCRVWRNGFLGMVNATLAECFDLENGIRVSKGKEKLEENQRVGSFDEVLEYDEMLLRRCVLWGVCMLLAMSDNDAIKAGVFNNKYEYEKVFALKGNFTEIEDCY